MTCYSKCPSGMEILGTSCVTAPEKADNSWVNIVIGIVCGLIVILIIAIIIVCINRKKRHEREMRERAKKSKIEPVDK